ncbi:hypothetical protein [Flavobacterium sp. 1355]|uniref:hypothetical protein n=1 Tax=Flavobacterium sp. 1355 TaxID=2806571 RepID=UPI001AE421C0|nr:hypothetical protein [Flavobacterium sp. 1355]MBP1222666.1 hypothetical protein [Flavobacterium sp. 1355]
MAYSKVTITFTEIPELNTYLTIQETTRAKIFVETFKGNRLASYQVKLPVLVGPDTYSGFVTDNFKTAFQLDHNFANEYTIDVINGLPNSGIGQVIITANYPGAVFSVYENDSGAILNFSNEPAIPEIAISDISFSEASTNKCQNIKVDVATSILAVKVLSPVVINPNSNNPFSFDWLRGDSINVLVEDANGKQANQTVILPSLLNASNFTINVNNSPNGATVIVENVNSTGLNLQYSLDSVIWQTSNTFSGLAVDDFILYVRDQFGCSFEKGFTVNEFGIQTPYFYISKSNSIRFANRITWGDSGNYKTDENTLSCEVDVDVPYKEVQQFQSADIITTQFKANYSSNVAKIIKEDLSEVLIPVEKKTNNIGIKDKRDARKYNIGSGKTGIYFISGNNYDYHTNTITGTYSLNGLLPEWAVEGNYIVIASAWFLIEDVVFDETKNADVIIISQNYTGPEVNIVVGSVFNRFNYEVYEFSVDMVNYIDQRFQVQLVNSDPNFPTITHLSEELWCKVKHEDVLEIKYRNTTNTDVFYATGIEFKIRVPFTFVRGRIDEESETHKTDTNTLLLSAELYEVDEFVFEPVTKEIWRKLMIALSHEIVSINGVSYVKNGSFSTEGPLESSNLYVLTAQMIKTGNIYNSQGSGNLDFSGSEVEVPGLIATETGFVRY